MNSTASLSSNGLSFLPSLCETDESKSRGKTTEDDVSNSIYRAIWRTLDGSIATSPVRSPVAADWKVVGSPSGSLQKINDPLDQLLEDEARLRDGSGILSGISSVDRTRRLRSASVIGELLHSGSSDYFFGSSAASPVNSDVSGIHIRFFDEFLIFYRETLRGCRRGPSGAATDYASRGAWA